MPRPALCPSRPVLGRPARLGDWWSDPLAPRPRGWAAPLAALAACCRPSSWRAYR
jgi:hypothetical protein